MSGGGLFSAYGQGIANKYNQEQERYRNEMRKIQEAHSQNAITVQEIYSQVDTKRKNLANEIEYMGAKGTIQVQSAVSGFSGRTSRAISNAALRAKTLRTTAIEEGHNRSRRSFELNRLNSAMGLELSLEDGWVQPVNWLAAAANDGQRIAQAMTGDPRAAAKGGASGDASGGGTA